MIDFKSLAFEPNDFHRTALTELIKATSTFTSNELSDLIRLLSKHREMHTNFSTELLNLAVPKTPRITKPLMHSLTMSINSKSTYSTYFTESANTAPVYLMFQHYAQMLTQAEYQYIVFSERNIYFNTLYFNKRLTPVDVRIRNIILAHLYTLQSSNQTTTLINHFTAELAYYQGKHHESNRTPNS
jgi:hypothetical protein